MDKGSPPCSETCFPCSPKVLAMPVFTLDVLTWLIRFSCSGLTSTATLMFHSDCMAICVEGLRLHLPWAGAPVHILPALSSRVFC